MLFLITLTSLIIRSLKQSANVGSKVSSGKGNEHTKAATKMVLAVTITFIALEAPYAVNTTMIGNVLAYLIVLNKDYFWAVHAVASFLTVINSFINFFVYCLASRRFRKNLFRIFPLRKLIPSFTLFSNVT